MGLRKARPFSKEHIEKNFYARCHYNVRINRGTPNRCEHCFTTDPAKKYEWASKTKNYADIYDYHRLCIPCHREWDRMGRITEQAFIEAEEQARFCGYGER